MTRVRANEFLFVVGMLSGDAAGNVIGEGEFDVQTAQVLRNIEAALKSAGASITAVIQCQLIKRLFPLRQSAKECADDHFKRAYGIPPLQWVRAATA